MPHSPGYVSQSDVLQPIGDNRHLPVYGAVHFHVYSRSSYTKTIWHYNNADVEGLNETYSNIDWNTFIDLEQDIHNKAKTVSSLIIDQAREFIPNRRVKIRSKDKPWYTIQVRKLVKLRNRFSALYNRTNNPVHRFLHNMQQSKKPNENKYGTVL